MDVNQAPDLFGAASAAGTPPAETTEEKKERVKAAEDMDITEHPEYKAALAKQAELGANLKNQGAIIDRLSKEQKKAIETSPIDPDKLPWKPSDVRTSKDLTEAELDDMTAREIEIFDDRAKMRAKENKAAEEALKAERLKGFEVKPEETEEKVKGDDLKTLVATEIGALSGGDAEKLRELNEAVAMLNLSGLTAEQVKERVKMANKLIPSYTPPKEQAGAAGKPVKAGGEADPFNSNAIIEAARKGNDGGYAL